MAEPTSTRNKAPKTPIPSIPPLPSSPTKETATQKRKPLSASELVSLYESQGFEPQEAPLKVIEDLQKLVARLASSRSRKKDKFMADMSRKLDILNTRVAVLDMKVDSKPGYPQAVAIGVGAAAIFQGVSGALPHVVEGFSQMWSKVRSSTGP
ncbi:hypothetical protein AMTRI_Chr01g136630 [Amborella trichopoda]